MENKRNTELVKVEKIELPQVLTKNQLAERSERFDIAKQKIEEFSQNLPQPVELETVSEHGSWISWNDHDVTGAELNNLINSLQKSLIQANDVNRDIVKEFSQVYKALEALDKEYINGIMATLGGLREVNKKLVVNQDLLADNQDSIDSNQQDISKTIEHQKQIIAVLKNFKEKLEGLAHIEDVDQIWEELNNTKNAVEALQQALAANAESFAALEKNCMALDKEVHAALDTLAEHNAATERLLQEVSAEKEVLAQKVSNATMLAGGALVVAVVAIVLNFI